MSLNIVPGFLFVSVGYLYSYAYQYLWKSEIVPVKPVVWYAMVITCGLLLYLTTRRTGSIDRHGRRFMVLSAAFITVAALSSVAHVLDMASGYEFQALITLGETFFLILVFFLLLRCEGGRESAAYAILFSVLLGIGLNAAEFMLGESLAFSTVEGRAAGFYGNSNLSGSMLVFGAIISVWSIPSRWRLFFFGLVFGGVALTFSRSSMLMWAVAFLLTSWFRAFSSSFSVRYAAPIIGVLFLGWMVVSGYMLEMFQTLGLSHLLNDNTAYRMQHGFTELSDGSALDRMEVAWRAWNLFLDHPFVGAGFGATTYADSSDLYISAHNQFLRLGAELGLVGLGLFLGLIGVLWIKGTPISRTIAMAYALSCVFSHNNLDNPAIAIVIAFALASVDGRQIVGAEQDTHSFARQKTPRYATFQATKNQQIHDDHGR